MIAEKGNKNAAKRTDKRDNGAIFKSCASFNDCVSEINNAQIDNTRYLVLGC